MIYNYAHRGNKQIKTVSLLSTGIENSIINFAVDVSTNNIIGVFRGGIYTEDYIQNHANFTFNVPVIAGELFTIKYLV